MLGGQAAAAKCHASLRSLGRRRQPLGNLALCELVDPALNTQHIKQIEQRIARLDQYLLDGLRPWQAQLKLLQTLPGIHAQGAAMLLVGKRPAKSS